MRTKFIKILTLFFWLFLFLILPKIFYFLISSFYSNIILRIASLSIEKFPNGFFSFWPYSPITLLFFLIGYFLLGYFILNTQSLRFLNIVKFILFFLLLFFGFSEGVYYYSPIELQPQFSFSFLLPLFVLLWTRRNAISVNNNLPWYFYIKGGLPFGFILFFLYLMLLVSFINVY